jgi:hypothetical protein
MLATARFEVDVKARPQGWDGLVARLLLIGDGCTASDRVRRGELLRSVPEECNRTMEVPA